jgi:hypothetical protein
MCLMCEQEDLYFLYLERLEQARRAARGEGAPANANWLWPTVATGASPTAHPRVDAKPAFVCDTPEK